MQHRMKKNQLSNEAAVNLLNRCSVGHLSTQSKEGYPYITPVHYVYLDGALYFHGLPKGTKIDNLKRNPLVCFQVDIMHKLLVNEASDPCDVETKYESVVVFGHAGLVDEVKEKESALTALIEKYTPDLSNIEMSEKRIIGTAVVRIDVDKMTAKHHGVV